MKFTKEQAIEDLNRKLAKEVGEPCLSSKTILNKVERTFAKLESKSDEETELSDFVDDVFPDILDMDKNLRKLNSDKISSYEKEFKEKWEKEHQKTPPTTPPTNGGGSENELMKQMQEEIRQLKEDNAKSKAEKEIMGKRSELVSKLKEKKIEDEKWIDAYIKKLPINADTDIDAEVNDALAFYNISNSHVGSGVTPQGGGSSASVDENEFSRIKKERESRIEQRSKL